MSFWKFLDLIGGIITYVRNFVINAFFLLFIFLFFIIIMAGLATTSDDSVPETNKIVFVDVHSTIYDAPRMESRIEVLLNTINGIHEEHIYTEQLKRIFDYASTDDEVEAVVMDLSHTESVRLDVIKSLEPAIEKFQKAGKRIYVYADSYSQSTYALASYADEIYLPKLGEVSIVGVNARNLYFKDFLDNVELTVFTPKAGTHKSAVEPFNRNDMSPQVKEEMGIITSDLWNLYADVIRKNRPDLRLENLLFGSDNLIALEEKTPFDKNIYQESGAVDKIMSKNGFYEHISKMYKVNFKYSSDKNGYDFDSTDAEQYFNSIVNNERSLGKGSDKIGVIYGLGEIGYQDPNDSNLTTFTPEHILPLIQKATKDDYKALILYLNTPGGSVTASEDIRSALVNYKNKTNGKIVVYMSGMAASGGYWISTVADTIVAQPSTITGSIGVFGMLFNGSELTEKIGIHEDGIGTNPDANLSFTAPITENQKKLIQLEINKTYANFIRLVSDSRKLERTKVEELAQGRIYTGNQALEINLVDKIGSFDTALDEARKLAESKNARVVQLLPKDDNRVNAVSNVIVKAVARYDRPMALKLVDDFVREHPVVKAAVSRESQIMIQPYTISY
ncbi:MAG: signal peptide peptidase SppA [Ruminobacter sp.]|uniref:Protease-4 n=1 Tax=Ruminobacter amylophilus TaxID=867 RepID=A0A662ZFH8_9GAMM|nr:MULTISPECIES: signal peptide peptidase SppA [Ruminobacter]MBQ3775556.1 signal peptide peptidase SppA [Ruminobacter sp.]SFO97083.1 protease-4 [Ruminobacter amylophilus]